jgi:hypothetical protein
MILSRDAGGLPNTEHENLGKLLPMVLLYTDMSRYHIHVHTTGRDPSKFGFFKKLAVYTCIYYPCLCIYCLFLEKLELARISTSCMYMYTPKYGKKGRYHTIA